MPQTEQRNKQSKSGKNNKKSKQGGQKSKQGEQEKRKPDPLEVRAQATLKRLQAEDPGLKQFLKDAHAYAVFPSVGKAALVLGGSYGRGVVYEQGKLIGFATLGQFTIGLQLGGDTFDELLVFENKEALDRFKQGKVRFAANASAVLVKAGAAGTADYEKGVSAFAYANGGMLLEAAIGGQKFNFKKDGEQNGGGEQKGEGREEGEENGGEQGILGRIGGGATGLIGKTAGGVMSTASKTGGLVKNHPIAATLVGAGVAWLAVKALREGGYFDGNEEEQDGEQDEESGQEKSGGRAFAR